MMQYVVPQWLLDIYGCLWVGTPAFIGGCLFTLLIVFVGKKLEMLARRAFWPLVMLIVVLIGLGFIFDNAERWRKHQTPPPTQKESGTWSWSWNGGKENEK
jgi:hypothetical protein